MKMLKGNQKFVIGVDGGGTKTTAAIADLKGKILKRAEIGSTNPNKIGFEKAIFNLRKLISRIIKSYSRNKICFCYLGLAGGLERDKEKREKIKKFLKKDFSFPIKVEGDQKIAFRSGTEKKEGVLIIAGTGSISIGWQGGREAISGGWDWLIGDQGSAFWTGRKGLEKVIKSFDGRTKNFSKLKTLIFKKFKINEEKDLYRKFYESDFVKKIAFISKLVDLVAETGDRSAEDILKEAGKELAQMAIGVIKKLKFKEKFPIVLIGGMFKSKTVLKVVKKEIKKFTPKAKFIQPKKEPVIGAVKLAIENFKLK